MKKRYMVLIAILTAAVCVAGYHNSYPIELNMVTLPNYISEFHNRGRNAGDKDTIMLYGSGVSVGNKEYYLLDVGEAFGYVALERGLTGRYKISHIGYGSGSFRKGIIENDERKYLLFAGRDPADEIRHISVEIQGFTYEMDVQRETSPFLFCIEIDDSITGLDLSLENIVFYDEEGNDITEMYDLSGGSFQ